MNHKSLVFSAVLLVSVLPGCSGDDVDDMTGVAGASGSVAMAGSAGTGGSAGSTAGAAAVAGSGGGAGAPPAAGCDAPATVFALEATAGGCAGVACHGGTFAPNLVGGMAAAEVLGPTGMGAPVVFNAGCGTLLDPTNIDNSAIMKKITGTTCGAQMPSGGMMTADQVACVRAWLESIAP